MGDVRTEVGERRVLLVEDGPSAVRLFEEAFGELADAVELTVVGDGEEALAQLFGDGDGDEPIEPDVVVLDLELPTVSGVDVLRTVREHDEFAQLPVVVVSQLDDQSTIDECYRLGATAYFVKPDDYDGLLRVAEHVSSFWGADAMQFPSTDV